MGDYCWMLYRDDANHPYKRKSYAKQFKFFSLELVLIAVLSGTVPRLKANIFHMCYSEKYFC